MELLDMLHQISQESQKASQPTDLVIGTVTKVEPLEITTNPAMAPLRAEVLYLTAAVVEKKIPVLTHSHTTVGFAHDHKLGEETTTKALTDDAFVSDEQLDAIACTEHGHPLPVKEGYILLNRALEVGDKVLLLRVQRGQEFIILSRIFKGG